MFIWCGFCLAVMFYVLCSQIWRKYVQDQFLLSLWVSNLISRCWKQSQSQSILGWKNQKQKFLRQITKKTLWSRIFIHTVMTISVNVHQRCIQHQHTWSEKHVLQPLIELPLFLLNSKAKTMRTLFKNMFSPLLASRSKYNEYNV